MTGKMVMVMLLVVIDPTNNITSELDGVLARCVDVIIVNADMWYTSYASVMAI